jgi:protein kinase X
MSSNYTHRPSSSNRIPLSSSSSSSSLSSGSSSSRGILPSSGSSIHRTVSTSSSSSSSSTPLVRTTSSSATATYLGSSGLRSGTLSGGGGSGSSRGGSSSVTSSSSSSQPLSRDAAVAYAFGGTSKYTSKQLQSSSSAPGGSFGNRTDLLAPSSSSGSSISMRVTSNIHGGSVKGSLLQQLGGRSSASSGSGSFHSNSGGYRQTVSTTLFAPEPIANVDDVNRIKENEEDENESDLMRAGDAVIKSTRPSTIRKTRIVFNLSDLTLSTTVGTGTFGRVRVVQFRPTKAWYALKIMKKSEILRLSQLDHILSEVKILSTTTHPFIVNMLGMHFDEKRLYLLFEYVPGGELFSYLRREGKFSESAAQFYAAEILLAFEHLHKSKVVYRDLKPENLLLTSKGHIKITDFGFAKVVQDRTYTLCGTPEYLAPEIIQSKGHDIGVDWWALGILIFEMLAGFPPFFDENPYGIYQKILAGKIDWPKHFSIDAKDLIKKLLTADRTRRLGCLPGRAQDIRDHPWFAKIRWDDLFALKTPAPYIPKVKEANDTSNFDSYPDSDGETAGKLSTTDSRLFIDIESAFVDNEG